MDRRCLGKSYPITFETESGQVRYKKKGRVAGQVWVPVGHWGWVAFSTDELGSLDFSQSVTT